MKDLYYENYKTLMKENEGRNKWKGGNSPALQWLGLCAFTAEGMGSIPGRGTKIPQDMHQGQKLKKFKNLKKERYLMVMDWKN